MNGRNRKSELSVRRLGRAVGVSVIALGLGGVVALGGCADNVGHSKTTTKSTTETPNETVTTTEVHEKDTTLTPR
ncbi:MAG: hypothetical protein AABZ53_10680 [Planctomycetota bacterium]